MSTTRTDELLDEILKLPAAEQAKLFRKLGEKIESPDESYWFLKDPEYLAELERRANDTENFVPITELWNKCKADGT